jgi:hypothetical protein
MTAIDHWKNDIPDVRSLATSVSPGFIARVPIGMLNANDTAAAIAGAMAYVATRFGFDAMQRSCVEIVRCKAAWSTSFGVMPIDETGRTPEAIALIAGLCRGLLPMAGASNMKAALSFWACESDFHVLASVLA